MTLASGIAPIADYLDRGINVALGNDGPPCSNTLDAFTEMRQASLLQKVDALDPTSTPAATVFEMATRNGAKAAGFDRVGELREGWKADIVGIDADRTARRRYTTCCLISSSPPTATTWCSPWSTATCATTTAPARRCVGDSAASERRRVRLRGRLTGKTGPPEIRRRRSAREQPPVSALVFGGENVYQRRERHHLVQRPVGAVVDCRGQRRLEVGEDALGARVSERE
ncbi:N-ethylammeline chlorohydrolase [Haloferax sp. ATCC BAA-644]|nr:N-ethylammeline chlorohydrolase [Haloferax sp. ATCC BAA-644]